VYFQYASYTCAYFMRIEKNTHNTHEIRIGQFADEDIIL
jgi:hypothetical protein